MVVKIFTSGDGPETRQAKELGKDLELDYAVEYFDADDATTTPQAELYDIYSYPTFVVAQDDGVMVECFRGLTPLASDVKILLVSA